LVWEILGEHRLGGGSQLVDRPPAVASDRGALRVRPLARRRLERRGLDEEEPLLWSYSSPSKSQGESAVKTIGPGSLMMRPVSSRVSRIAASAGVSPCSRPPPTGNHHAGTSGLVRSMPLKSRTRPRSSTRSTFELGRLVATTCILADDLAGSGASATPSGVNSNSLGIVYAAAAGGTGVAPGYCVRSLRGRRG
jgi:hypothetical protein